MEFDLTDEFIECICFDPETQEQYDRVCLARQEGGICPQLPVLEKIKRQLQWLADEVEFEGDAQCVIDNILEDLEN